MPTKAFKQDKIEQIKEKFAKAKVAYITDYRGYSVEEISALRRLLQAQESDYSVTKNTLAKFIRFLVEHLQNYILKIV